MKYIRVKRLTLTIFLMEEFDLSWAHGLVYKTTKALVARVVPPAQVKNYSFHSFRIYLACALKKAGVSETGIMEFCRWRSRSSLPIYARIDAQEYMETVLLALISSRSSWGLWEYFSWR